MDRGDLAACAVATAALALSCSRPEPAVGQVALPATGVVARAERVSPPLNAQAGKTVFVALKPGAKLRDVLDLSIFGPLLPGMTCPEAATALSVSTTASCSFELPAARVDVAYEPSSSGGGTFHRRTLYAYPKAVHSAADQLLSSPLAPYRSEASPGIVLELIVAEHGDHQRAWVLVDGPTVRSVNWWTPASRRGPDS